uniref:Uncharacterized protein n=1 Tax=viral metagenome TaxID=1070528 RepID=A0A6H1ZH98_9ZZZZ
MELVFAWAENQPDKFIVSEDGYLYLKPGEKKNERKSNGDKKKRRAAWHRTLGQLRIVADAGRHSR